MPRYAVINEDNVVVNVIEAYSSYRLPQGFFMVQTEIGDIGNIYNSIANSFDKSNQMPSQQAPVPVAPLTGNWQQYTGAARLGVKNESQSI